MLGGNPASQGASGCQPKDHGYGLVLFASVLQVIIGCSVTYLQDFLGGGSGRWHPCLAENQKRSSAPRMAVVL